MRIPAFGFVMNHLVSAAVVILLTMVVLRPIDSYDIWWHLNSGLWMVEHGQILQHDIWSFTRQGEPWINVAWIFQYLVALAYMMLGDWGLYITKAALIFLSLWILLVSTGSRRRELHFALAFVLLLPFIYGHLHLRPHLIELICLALVVWLSNKNWNIRHVLLGSLVLLIWSNSHASAIVGVVALVMQALLGPFEEGGRLNARLVSVGMFILPLLLTPYGLEYIELLLVHGNSDIIDYYVAEWGWGKGYPLGLWVLLLVVVFFAIARRIGLSIAEWFLLAFFLYYSLQFKRFELELGFLLLAPLAKTFSVTLVFIEDLYGKRLALLVTAGLVVLHGYIYADQLSNLGVSHHEDVPVTVSKYPYVTSDVLVKISGSIGRPVRVLNDYGLGGFISFRSGGLAQVYVDSRMSTLYPEKYVVVQYESNGNLRSNILDRYDIDAMLMNLEFSGNMGFNDPDWQLVAYDAASVLYVRKSLLRDIVLPDIRYDPAAYSNSYVPDVLRFHLDETYMLLRLDQSNAIAMNHLAVFHSNSMATVEQREHISQLLKRSVEAKPGDVFNKATLAYLMLKWDDRVGGYNVKDFLHYLPDSNELGEGVQIEYDLAYAKRLLKLGLFHDALEYLYPEQRERMMRMDARPEFWVQRALLHNRLGDNSKARNSIDTAREMIGAGEAEKNDYINRVEAILNTADGRSN